MGGTCLVDERKGKHILDPQEPLEVALSACYLSTALRQGKKEATVDLDNIVEELKSERDQIGRVIASLLEGAGKGVVPIKAARPERRVASNPANGCWKVIYFTAGRNRQR